MKCRQCESELSEEANFCPECGNPTPHLAEKVRQDELKFCEVCGACNSRQAQCCRNCKHFFSADAAGIINGGGSRQ